EAGSPVRPTATGNGRARVPAAFVDGGVDRRRIGEVEMNGLHPGQRDLGEVHHQDLGAGALDELGRGRAHATGAADDERALAVVPEGVERCHATPVSLYSARALSQTILRFSAT